MSYCPIINKDNNLFIQSSEVCGFKALEKLRGFNYGEFNSNAKYTHNSNTIFPTTLGEDFNYNYRNPYSNDYIYQYDKNKKDLCYQIGKDEWALNCVIEHQNPLYTYNSQTKTCGLIPNISLPSGFKIGKEKKKNYIYFQSDNDNIPVYAFRDKKAFCENKWFDWIVTPNYHFGNQYEKDSGVYSKEDVRKCYKPCGLGYMPYFTTDNKYICVPKSEASDGIYANKFDFSPIAIINLLGNSKESIEFLQQSFVYDKFNLYSNNPDIETNFYINSNLKNPAEINMCMEAIKTSIITNIINKNIIQIPIINNTNVISYRNPNFKETDEELLTLRGMANSDMLSDPILIHTYLLAYHYHNFITSYVTTNNNYLNDNNFTLDKIRNHKFNIKYNFDNLFGDNSDYNQNKDKFLQRVANLLYKAINICYDNKSDFSKNLIIYTDRAFKNNYYYYGRLINNNEFYNISYVTNFNFSLEIPFLNSEIYDYIQSKYKSDINKDKIKDFYSVSKNKQVFFYNKEDSERTNECKSGEIKDGDKCKICKDVCNKDTCKTNMRCTYFCDDICNEIEENDNQSGGRCGDRRKPSLQKKEETTNKRDIKDPIDEAYNIPDFRTIFKSAIKIFFALIILYMCYIFYQIYGETIMTLLNLLIFNIYKFTDWIVLKFQSNVNQYEHEFHVKEYIRKNASDKYERVMNKLKTPIISS